MLGLKAIAPQNMFRDETTSNVPSRLNLAAPENMLGLKAIAPQNMFRDATTTGLAPCTHEGRHLGCVRHGSVVHFDDDAAQSRCLKCPEMYRVLHQLILFMCNGPELICLRLHRCPPPISLSIEGAPFRV